MNVNFAAALATLGAEAAFRIANSMRAPSAYVLESVLPERNMFTYHVDSGSMTVRATMAGLVAMDSDYPPSGYVEMASFLQNTAKIANHTKLPEAALRSLQTMIQQLTANGGDTTQAVVDNALNFLQLVVLQPQLDVSEWLRGQAIGTGAINWQFNKKGLVIDYGVPAGNINTLRTIASNAAYAGSASAFWADVAWIRRTLRSSGVRAIIVHPDTIDAARYNAVNNMVVTAEGGGQITFRKIIPATGAFTQDAGDVVTLVSYGLEGEVLNPADPADTLIVPFFPRGRMVGIGNNARQGFRVGQGSQDAPAADQTLLGYTHLAPTVEGGGRPGRWSDMFTPQFEPWSLHGRAASNQIPVIEAPELLAIARTELA